MAILKYFLSLSALLLSLTAMANEPYDFTISCARKGKKCRKDFIYSDLRANYGCDDLTMMDYIPEKKAVYKSRKCLLIPTDAKGTPCPSGTEARNYKGLPNAKICIKAAASATKNSKPPVQ